ncbi:MAG: hypothetical protein RLZZ301_1287 [Bacteroidota bacterium]|jgi:hypothetical protein
MLAALTSIGFWENTMFSVEGHLCQQEALPLNDASLTVQFEQLEAAFRQIQIAPTHPYYPKPSDLKILRSDTVAALILAQEMQAQGNWETSFAEDGALLVANSNFIDDNVLDFEQIAQAIAHLQTASDPSTENKLFGAGISPLLPLRTLTNGAQSFIAQYLHFYGSSSTYGSTGIATVQAVKDACNLMALRQSSSALIGGCHFANLFSFINNCHLLNETAGYAEASATSFLMLEPVSAASASKARLWLESWHDQRQEFEEITVDLLIYGGAFTPSHDAEIYANCAQVRHTKSFSWFAHTGNLGAAEFGMLLAAAMNWLQAGQSAFLYLEDVYGVWSGLKVSKP